MKSTEVKNILFFILIVLIFLSNSLHAADSLVSFGVDSDFPPYSYVANETAQGFENDLISLIFEEGNYKLDFIYGYQWGDIYNQTRDNKMDICGTLVRTPERAEHVLFTDDAYTRYYGVFTKGGAETIDINNLGKYRLGAVKGYYSEVIVKDKLKAARYEVFNTYLQMINALINNRIDAFIETTEVVKYYISKESLEGKVVLQHDGLFLQSVPFGVSKARPDIVEFINRRLREIRESGEYEIFYIKNFSSHSPEYYETEKKRERLIIIGATAGLAATALAFIVLLKLQVKRATEKIVQREADIKLKNQELEALNEELNGTLEEMEATNEELTSTYEALLESEKKIRSISNNIQSGMIYQAVINKDGTRKFTYLSGSVKMLYGINPEEGMADPMLIYNKVYEGDRERLAEEEEYAIRTLSTFKTEIRMVKPSGDIRWSSFVSIPRVLDNGLICFDGIESDITDLKKSHERINNFLKEKELLLQEVHHRIKNNMNTIKGLLTLQIASEENQAARESLRDAENRVQSMITLYDRLYCTENYREMSVKDYLESLSEDIIGSFPNRGIIKIETDIEDYILNVNILTPLGIIVNELITNMMKYAFHGRDSGIIKLSAAVKEKHVKVSVSDNGVGIPESVSFDSSTGFGLELVGMLTEQLEGCIRIERGGGTKFILEFDV